MYNYLKFLFRKKKFRSKWRKINAHNQTIAKNIFPLEKVKVGKMSYGILDVNFFDHSSEQLIIGNFVSIADDVKFILGGNHQIYSLANYPLYSKLISLNPNIDAQTKGAIIVEDEVWIGTGVKILSGVRIKKGSIIAAGSVLTKDVPEYAIFGGNPARLIKYRFNEELRNNLKDVFLSDLELSTIINNIGEFYKTMDDKQLMKIKTIINSTNKNCE
ncbi:CatB-related O-acetyltransferase [Maribacter sp. MAR_2009_72]|uniref:CatB-related O-acetyltransferase n=1 Tax=Maribacter sp. MAR_2009_72 TaxID=1250050 RepID=UPI00119C0516|nr:CatB-related O-acetyltransferase [Maribacter sp. MAR_2009_72]TVZ16939.1 acetyltransferase-like isoleucine patch superfamily enzyme [Maribacter sp. MAR_2009_72]